MKSKRELNTKRYPYSLEELLKDICEELNFKFISDIRIKENREAILQYLIAHNIEQTYQEVYLRFMKYYNETL